MNKKQDPTDCRFWNEETMICSKLNHKIDSSCHIDCHCRNCPMFKKK